MNGAGEHLRDHWAEKNKPLEASAARLAWKGRNPQAEIRNIEAPLRLFHGTWENPLPDIKIES